MAIKSLVGAVIVALFSLCAAGVSNRNVEIKLYPDCEKYPICSQTLHNDTIRNVTNGYPNLAYVRSAAAKEKSDILHFVITTISLPSVLVVHTKGDENEKLAFNWTQLMSDMENGTKVDIAGAISPSGKGKIDYSFAVVFSKLIEYDDINDAANLKDVEKDNKTMWNIRDFTVFQWMNMTMGKKGSSIIFKTDDPQPAPYQNKTQGSMHFEFEINKEEGRESALPRLLYNANNTQINFALDGYIPTYNKSRFALEMTVVATHSSQGMSIKETRSIDDEYSPGVFRVVDWYAGGKNTGYVQWKPVCYLKSERARDVATEVTHYDLLEPSKVQDLDGLLNQSLARAFFGKSMYDNKTVIQKATNVSFGLSKDGFYLKHNYTVWMASVGYGQPPVETISTLVIIIICIGLGLPVVIIIFGGIFVCARRKKRGGYTAIEDEVSRSNPHMN